MLVGSFYVDGVLAFASWGATFAIAVVQDVLACGPLRLFIIHGMTMMAVRPQLKKIYHILNNIAITRFAQFLS